MPDGQTPGAQSGAVRWTTITEVLTGLDGVIAVARERGTADGYFAALYRRVTAEVEARILRGDFADAERMARFDVIFARRYLDAWHRHERGEAPSACWGVAFGCGRSFWPVVMQHLLVGMNAHINLDLGVAAAEVSPGAAIHDLEADFRLINQVLADLVDDVQQRMGEIWPGVKWLDRAGGGIDEKLVNFSIDRARAAAWRAALALAAEPDAVRRQSRIDELDTQMARIGRGVLAPGWRAAAVLAVVRLRERGSVAEKLDVLLR